MTMTRTAVVAEKRPFLPQDVCPLSLVVASIGHQDFADRVLSFADAVVGADHIAVYQMRGGVLSLVHTADKQPSQSVSDLTSHEIRRQLKTVGADAVRVDIATAQHPCLSRRCGIAVAHRQHVTIVARKNAAAFFVSIIRSGQRQEIDEREMRRLRSAASTLISAIEKHHDLTESKPNLAPALTSLTDIEECLLTATDLSRREAEVCARILYGLSSYGIALDLGIGKESVMTYRKRAYLRLGIGSQRELLIWYLGLWSETGDESRTSATGAKRLAGSSRRLLVQSSAATTADGVVISQSDERRSPTSAPKGGALQRGGAARNESFGLA